MRLRELIKPNETAVAVMTRGDYLDLDYSKSCGRTGIWVVDQKRVENTSKVVIYLRSEGRNDVLMGDIIKAFPETNAPGRFWIQFVNLVNKGPTPCNWKEFAETGARPVRYWPPA